MFISTWFGTYAIVGKPFPDPRVPGWGKLRTARYPDKRRRS
jgi:hypothetical protein